MVGFLDWQPTPIVWVFSFSHEPFVEISAGGS